MREIFALNYTGAHRDSITTAYALGNGVRWYMPALMRFNAPDSLSPFQAGGLHPYIYCGDDPIDRVDPSGHINWSVTGRAIRRFLTRLGARERRPAILGGAETDDAKIGADSGNDHTSHVTGTLERPTAPSAPALHFARTATMLEKIDLGLEQVLVERVFVKRAPGRTTMLTRPQFEKHYVFASTEHIPGSRGAGGADSLMSESRICLPRRPLGTDTGEPPRPSWTTRPSPSQTAQSMAVVSEDSGVSSADEEDFDFFPSFGPAAPAGFILMPQ
jgi:RHS repeat-associated protein